MGIIGTSGLWTFVHFINFQIRQTPATNQHFFLVITTLFLLNLVLLCGLRFLKKKNPSIFLVLNLFTFFKVGKIIVSKYGQLMLPGVFPDKITSDIDFTDEAVVDHGVPVVKYFSNCWLSTNCHKWILMWIFMYCSFWTHFCVLF